MLFLATDADIASGVIFLTLIILFCILCVILYFLPSIVAFHRDHHYKWVIFGVNLFFGATGIAYLGVLIWAFWPRNTGLVDLISNDLTTNSYDANAVIYSKQGANKLIQRQAELDMAIYVLKNGIQNGPYTSIALTSFLQSGNYSYQDLCWYNGAPGWLPIAQVATIIRVPPIAS